MGNQETHDKQALKTQRVKSYFIQAAKEIILNEGAENVSVRKVAELAGYTYTTLYNYFADLNELLQETKNVMIQEVMEYMQRTTPNIINDLEDLKKVNRSYMAYYVDHPHIFMFFYSYRLNPVERSTVEIPDYSKLYQETYRSFVLKGIIQEKDVPVIAKTIIYAIQGLLALYFSDNGMTEIDYESIDKITDYLLKGRNEG